MKTIKLIKQAPAMHWVGDGFPVRSIFSYDSLGKEMDPFLLLDYAEPYEFKPGTAPRGVGSHPHRGFETVTLAFQGEVSHRDSHGGGGTIGAGDVQWMTAAAGLLHEEFHSDEYTRKGGPFQMVQLWVNLPAKDKMAKPAYQPIAKGNIPVVGLPDAAGTARIVAGRFGETAGAARTFTPIDLWDLHLAANRTVVLPAKPGHTTALLVMDGEIAIDGKTAGPGQLVIYEREGDGIEIATGGAPAHLLYMGGEPIGEPIVGYGPFVMNTKQQILEAIRDFQAGGMGDL